MGKRYSNFSKEEYTKVKALANMGLTERQLKDVTGRSSSLIFYVKRSKDYEGYKALSAERFKDRKPVVAQPADIAKAERNPINGRKAINEEEFALAKMLRSHGVPYHKIAKQLGYATGTVTKLVSHETLADYRKWVNEQYDRYHPKKTATTELKQGVDTPVPTPEPTPVAELKAANFEVGFDFKLLNDNLVLLANKMERYTKACEDLTIATYALRKTANGDKPFWRK